MNTSDIHIPLRDPLPHVRDVLLDPSRFKVVACGRRWTKTEGVGLTACIDGHGPKIKGWKGRSLFSGAAHGKRILLVTTPRNLMETWRLVRDGPDDWDCAEKGMGRIAKHVSELEHRIVFPNGGVLHIRSGEKPSSLRGPGWDGVGIDEAAWLEEDVWNTVRPALSERRGWAIFFSTPNAFYREGKWFKKLFDSAPSRPGWARFQRPSWDNPKITAAEIEEERRSLPSLAFRQEIAAEFVETEGARVRSESFRYFREDERGYILGHTEGEERVGRDEGYRFGMADLAASLATTADHFALGAFLVTPKSDILVLDVLRRRLEGPDQLPAIRQMMQKWALGFTGIEATAYQLTLVQQGLREGLSVRPVKADRDKVSRGLQLESMFQAGKVFFRADAPWLFDLETEVLAFTGAKDGKDDQWDILAYAAIQVGGYREPRMVRISSSPGVRRPIGPPPPGITIPNDHPLRRVLGPLTPPDL